MFKHVWKFIHLPIMVIGSSATVSWIPGISVVWSNRSSKKATEARSGEAGEIVWSWSFVNDWFFKYRCNYCMYVYWRYALCHTLHMYIYIYALYILRWQFLDVLQMLSRSFRGKTCCSSIPSGSLVCLVKRYQQTMQSTFVRRETRKLPVPFPKENENCQVEGF